MKDSYTKNKLKVNLFLLFIVCCLYSTFAQEKIKIPSKVEVLNTLKDQHPRLISAGKIKTLIQEDELAQQIWISNLKFAQELLNKKPLGWAKTTAGKSSST